MAHNLIIFLAAFAVLAVSLFLVFHNDYEDELVGRIALCLMSFAALARLIGLIEAGFYYEVSKAGMLLWCGVAMFLCRHCYRFARRRYGWFGYSGQYDWRESKK